MGEWKNEISKDYAGYKNHVYRMIHFCLAQDNFSVEEREKIIIAGCFHDIGIWTENTFDYLSPSVELAKDYLLKSGLENWTVEIGLMIETHHKLREYQAEQNSLVEIFRKGDLVDFSLGFIKCGVPGNYVKEVKDHFPNAGFHKGLVKLAGGWVCRHPLNPLPGLKW